MDIEQFREYCLNLPGTTEDMKWEHLCFLVENKIFVIVSLEDGNSFSSKCAPDEFDEWVARDGVGQAFHMAKRQWVQVDRLDVLPDKLLKKRVEDSRALVIAKLPKKVQEKYK